MNRITKAACNGAMALLIIAGAGVALAQPPGGRMDPAQMVERQVTNMKDRLKLTDDQAAKIKPIIEESMKSTREIFEKYGPPQQGQGPSEEMRTAMQKSREETNKKIAAVLNDDQKKEFEKMMSERRGMGMGGPGGPGGRRRPPEQQ